MISAKRLWILSVIVAVAGLTPASLCAQQYVYTNNNDPIANTTTAFNVSPTGEITILNTYQTGGLGFATSYPGLASVVTAAPGMTTCLYVSDAGSGDVAAFGIDRLNGTLTTVASSPFSTGGTGTLNGIGLAVGYSSPTTLLFAANSASSTVTAFIVHGDCRLTIHKASTVPYAVAGMEVTSSGQYLIVGYQNGMVDSLQIAYPGGALTELGPFTAQGAAAGVDISCDSSTAYFGDSTSTGMEVEPFSIGSTGLLAPLATFTNSSGNNSSNVLLSTDGNTLFVDNNTSLQITTLAVGTGGGADL